VVGADSRATAGPVVADKFCLKLNKLSENIYCCGAGTAADLHQVSAMLESNMKLQELNTERKPRVISALRIAKQHLFKYMGYVGAYLVIGGVDFYGPVLYSVHADGGSSKVPFLADGSGSLAAMGVLETYYKLDMNEAEAIDLICRALEAGMAADLASGNTLCYAVITKEKSYEKHGITPEFCHSTPKDLKYRYAPKSTTVLKSKEMKLQVIEAMDVS